MLRNFTSVLPVSVMEFSLDKPGFSASSDLSQEALQDSVTPPPSTGSSSSASAPSSGDSSRHNCPKCRRRMSKPVFDCHTFCYKCWGFNCTVDQRCDECLDWSLKEVEAYVKHRKSLISKEKKGKDSLPKPLPSPGPVQPPSPSLSYNELQ